MALSMALNYMKQTAFELDHVIAYKKSSKFNSQNVLMEVNLENFLPRKLLTIRYHILLIVHGEKLLLSYVLTYLHSCKKHSRLLAFTSFHSIHVQKFIENLY